MKKYSYPAIVKFFFKYGDKLTYFLILSGITILTLNFSRFIDFIMPFAVYAIIGYLTFTFFKKIRKYTPLEITIDGMNISCKSFMNDSPELESSFTEITDVKGGIFAHKPSKPIEIHFSSSENPVFIYAYLTDYNLFLTTLMTNVKREIYKEMLEKLKTPVERKRFLFK